MKKIIVLSDGTGNGAAKRNKTNVWRLYRALDLQAKDQIAMYDDGVGSQEFLPLKILGGAFGFGLRRNVLELYKFVCRNYKENDKIYLFGFSRGAFTVRLLAGLITTQGLCQSARNEAELHEAAQKNYGAYRAMFGGSPLYHAYLRLRGHKKAESQSSQTNANIEFIGVWDTVDAYGLPIDELATLWHWCIFPIKFKTRNLSKDVMRACHALSVDDERLTFHPVLWDESGETADPKRIEQVWFSGVHSDVGGGYPMNELSLVPLDWMLQKIEQLPTPLKMIEEARKEYSQQADWHGKQHDSRSGLGAYYRYSPRNIGKLCDDKRNNVKIAKPQIHSGVLERIKENTVPYAPTGLPADYEVAYSGEPKNWVYEEGTEAEERDASLVYARDKIFLRKGLYLGLLSASIVLFVSRFVFPWSPSASCVDSACYIEPVLTFLRDRLPDFAGGWFDTLSQNPGLMWGLLGVFLFFFYWKTRLSQSTQEQAANAWSVLKSKGDNQTNYQRKTGRETFLSGLRSFTEKYHKAIIKPGIVLVLVVASLLWATDTSLPGM